MSRAPSRRWRSDRGQRSGCRPQSVRRLRGRPLGPHDRLAGGAPHVAAAIESEDRAAIMDSMILCKFLRGVFTEPYEEWARLLQLVTGWDVSGDELRETASRIVLSKRLFNLREGWSRADDGFRTGLSQPLELGSGRTAALSPERLRGMIDAYYGPAGWTRRACPPPSDFPSSVCASSCPEREDQTWRCKWNPTWHRPRTPSW